MTAPQRKMIMKIPSGIIDQVISSADEPSICSASTPRRRRYMVANTTIMAKIATHINADNATRKMYRASILPAPAEARIGQSGKLSNIKLNGSPSSGIVGSRSHAEHHDEECSKNEHRCASRQLQHSANDCSVFPGVRVVVVAVEQHLINHCADLAVGRLN